LTKSAISTLNRYSDTGTGIRVHKTLARLLTAADINDNMLGTSSTLTFYLRATVAMIHD
jgi:hypothetical protein